MEIIKLKIDELKPYENNPRINDKAIDYVAKSIQEYGFKVPLVIDKNNIIVTGHTRYEASKKLGLKEIPCIVADDLTDEQIKAFRIADNKVSDYSIWDNKKLLLELDNLDLDNFFTGFEISDLFENIKELSILDEGNNAIIDENEEGIVYSIQFKTQNVKLIEQIKELIEKNKENIL